MKYLIGKIKNTHGLKGGVVIKELTDFDRFKKDEVIFCDVDGQDYELKIKDVTNANKGLIVYFYDKHHISHVQQFKGCELYTNKKPELKEDEHHYYDLIGKKVYNQHNNLIGEVIDIMDVPQGHILRVKTNKKDALIPFNDVFIKEIEEHIIIEEIKGLI